MTFQTLTYIGRRISRDGKLVHFYDSGETTLRYPKPLVTGAKIGAQVEITLSEESPGQFYVSGARAPRVTDSLPDDDRLLRWALEDKEAGVTRSRTLESQRIGKNSADPLLRALEPVRAEIASLRSDRQLATVSWIITYLLTGKSTR